MRGNPKFTQSGIFGLKTNHLATPDLESRLGKKLITVKLPCAANGDVSAGVIFDQVSRKNVGVEHLAKK
jgi:hypothetical protein